jgi:CubicO group peptidase (beta-lactamase class C family)
MAWLDEVYQIIDDLIEGRPLDEVDERGTTLAVVVMHHGEVVAEGYGVRPDTPFGPGGPVQVDTPLISWSVAKSIAHAAVGLAVGDGVVHVNRPAPVGAWHGTPKTAITLEHLLTMRSGLRFVEDYVDDTTSHCLDMLFGAGVHDHAGYAAALPLDHEPGTVWNYSSGTTNIVARVLADAVGASQEAMVTWLSERLFEPLGMSTAEVGFDTAGTWVASSYVYASGRDFARFGEWYRNDGCVKGRRLLPEGWVQHGARPRSVEPDTGLGYGAHWWWWPTIPTAMVAQGYDGQLVIVEPSRAATVVHLGQWPATTRAGLRTVMTSLVELLPPVLEPSHD